MLVQFYITFFIQFNSVIRIIFQFKLIKNSSYNIIPQTSETSYENYFVILFSWVLLTKAMQIKVKTLNYLLLCINTLIDYIFIFALQPIMIYV